MATYAGVSANDSHQNVGLVIRLGEGDKAQFEDGLGKKLFEIEAGSNSALQPLLKDKKTGDMLFELRVDRYEHSLRHVGTHLLMKELNKNDVWEALDAGRAYVAFDWLADAAGFDFAAVAGANRHEMGSRITLEKGLRLCGRAPLYGDWRLMRNGKVVAESAGTTFDFAIIEPGNFRVEVWLTIASEKMIWILSNPIYIRG